ncbi:TerB family tellurite resistance protein [bacterium SCSIO 12696]|nr:TerB family tellurite resistance protein [bacterium SCSIO 12696]
MIEKLRQWLTTEIEPINPDSTETLELAAAALLVEVMTADNEVSLQEEQIIRDILIRQFELTGTDIDALFEEARNANHQATGLYRFTRKINESYSAAQRFQLVVYLWQVAYSDGELDKYEEGTIRQICELIHVSHSDFIRAKHQAQKNY